MSLSIRWIIVFMHRLTRSLLGALALTSFSAQSIHISALHRTAASTVAFTATAMASSSLAGSTGGPTASTTGISRSSGTCLMNSIGDNNADISFINASVAKSIDDTLMSAPGFSLDTLMELAGFSVACAAHDFFEIPHSDGQQQQQRKVVILCGPGNNGGDGLVAARHLKHFGFDVRVVFPKQSPKFDNLKTQCTELDIPILSQLDSTLDEYLVQEAIPSVIDAIFGFSFEGGQVREPFNGLIGALSRLTAADTVKVLSVDIPSGWSVDQGDIYGTNFLPQGLISLTAPKLCARDYSGTHYVGGRFMPPKLAAELNLKLVDYGSGADQVVKLPPLSAAAAVTRQLDAPTSEGVTVMYVTASSSEEAKRIAKELVMQKLVACVNLIPGITSIYEWQGAVEESTEVLMMIKTRASLVDDVTRLVKSLHSYELPEAIAVDVTGGSQAYIDWVVRSSTK